MSKMIFVHVILEMANTNQSKNSLKTLATAAVRSNIRQIS
jgi:hypothetical protein